MTAEFERVAIILDHYHYGPLRVAVYDEASWWMRCRQWSCVDDPELGTFDDDEFDETLDQISALLAIAR